MRKVLIARKSTVVIARRLAANRRLLCASPGYLDKQGTPRTPQDLARHN
jgi:LysR family transcriptional activator of dmlA